MISQGALVIYKAKPAIVKERADEKYTISLTDGSLVKVRDKDIELIHGGPVKSFGELETACPPSSLIRETWELLLEESAALTLKDLASFIENDFTPCAAFTAYRVLQDGLYFTGSINSIIPRSKKEVEAEEAKRNEKQRESGERTQFIELLKKCIENPVLNPFPEEYARYMQDVEALAYGKSSKSRTMKELKFSETPEDAHALLLKTGIWSNMVNPYPSRFGLSLNGAVICPDFPPEEERRGLTHLAAFAIDSPWSNDPDDAVSIEEDTLSAQSILYVHVADPAASIRPDSPAEKEARDRGTTLYLPETTSRMLAEETLPMFALGLKEISVALTFKMTIDKNGEVTDTEIFPSVVKVTRMTYEEADKEMNNNKALIALYDLAMRISKRRTELGAVNIELPEVHISLENNNVKIEPLVRYRSAVMIRELMIITGEGAGNWAGEKGLPFPYLSQEAELPSCVLEGYAGSMQLRKGMRPRLFSTKPGRHQGLGLDIYTQVTSPLRRYTDLLAHMQIRAFLRNGELLNADEIASRLGYSEAGVIAAAHTDRATDNHWKMVYLADKKDTIWNAIAIEKKGNRWSVIIPGLALETQAMLQKDVSPNDEVKLVLKSVNIPRLEAIFVLDTD